MMENLNISKNYIVSSPPPDPNWVQVQNVILGNILTNNISASFFPTALSHLNFNISHLQEGKVKEQPSTKRHKFSSQELIQKNEVTNDIDNIESQAEEVAIAVFSMAVNLVISLHKLRNIFDHILSFIFWFTEKKNIILSHSNQNLSHLLAVWTTFDIDNILPFSMLVHILLGIKNSNPWKTNRNGTHWYQRWDLQYGISSSLLLLNSFIFVPWLSKVSSWFLAFVLK